MALHEIKALGGFGKEDKSSFDRAMVELQMGMFITMTGRKQKKNKYGIEYGWNSTVFTTVENFWAERDFEIRSLDAEESYEKIRQQILLLIFAGVTLGGLGTVYGALIGSVLVGLFVEISTIWLEADLKYVGALVIMILVLLVRPQGILGRRERIG